MLRKFSIASLAAIAVTALGLGYFHQRFAVDSLLIQGEQNNAALTQLFANTVWPTFGDFLASAEARDAPALSADPHIAALHAFVLEKMRGLSIAKVKIYGLNGKTLFSTERSQIGEDKSRNAGFVSARSGIAASELTHRFAFSAFERTVFDRDLISSYLPVRDSTGTIVAVFEVYDDVTRQLQTIANARTKIVAGIVGTLFLLYLVLLVVVRRADQARIHAEHSLRAILGDLERRIGVRTAELSTANSRLSDEVDVRRRAEAILEAKRDALIRQQSAMGALLASPELQSGDLHAALMALTRTAANVLSIERASIWVLDRSGATIECRSLYERQADRHTCGLKFSAADYPRYFEALHRKEEIAADDAHKDPRTCEFSQTHLGPLGITSMLDVPMLRNCELHGVVCIEHVGLHHAWTAEERLFAAATASLAALAFERDERRQTEDRLHAASDSLAADVAQRVLTELALRESQRLLELAKDEAQAANRAKSTFLATMSHEIRTPLNGIVSIIEILADGGLRDEQRFQIELARQAADQLLNVIGNVLDMSKLEAGQLELEAAPFQLEELVHGAAETFAIHASRKGIELIVDCDACEDMLIGDATRLKQVILNLIGNAIKFTQAGHVLVRVVVAATDAQVQVRLAVHDTGVGIAPDALPHVMEKFVQASSSTARQYGGTGLGLAICKQLVEAMGGTLRVESTLGVGSRFIAQLTLPASPSTGDVQPGWSWSRAILCSPNAALLDACSRLIRYQGVKVTATTDASRLPSLVRSPDASRRRLVVLDPGLRGTALEQYLGEVRAAAHKNDRLIILLDPTLDPEQLEAATHHASSIITKPVSRRKLGSVVSEKDEQRLRASAPTASEASTTDLTPRLVLVAEDDRTNRYVVQKYLEQLGWQAQFVENGATALRAASRQRFDVILMDVQMPVMDGLAATRAIRRNGGPNQETPIIALTANAFVEDVKGCLEAGMNHHLSKPLKRQALVDALDRYAQPIDAAQPQSL